MPRGRALLLFQDPGTASDQRVELRGFEPLTFSLRTRRATNCATAPGASYDAVGNVSTRPGGGPNRIAGARLRPPAGPRAGPAPGVRSPARAARTSASRGPQPGTGAAAPTPR